jgi:uncharacterized protein YdhG (YjbR/CyaY superfamily)
MSDVDDLAASLNDSQREAVQRLCDIVSRVVPDAEQGRSYGMAAFRYSGKPLLGVAVSKEHMSLHPFSPAVIEAVADQLAGYSLSKGTIRFTAERPVPDTVIEQLVRRRVAEIDR